MNGSDVQIHLPHTQHTLKHTSDVFSLYEDINACTSSTQPL